MNRAAFFRLLPRPHIVLIFMAMVLFCVDFGLKIRQDDGGTGFLTAALSLLVFAFAYWKTRNYRQYACLQYFHILSFFAIPAMLIIQLPDIPYPGNPAVFGMTPDERTWMWVLGSVAVLGQLAFLYNLIAGFRRGRKTQLHD